MKKIKESQVFKPLKEAIERVLIPYGQLCELIDNHPAGCVVSVPVDDLRVLMLTYNEFFVEPEDDEEWNKYQSE